VPKYQQPSGIKIHNKERPLLSTPQGGRIALDAILFSLWQQANGRELKEILDFPAPGASPDTIRAALACLVEAGLLVRLEEQGEQGELFLEQGELFLEQKKIGGLVSAVIVGYNSREWFEECLSSLFSQTYSPLEVIVVDNASSDDSGEWLKANYPKVKLLCLETTRSLAYAINQGVAAAMGANFLILNPDIKLEPDAVSYMVAVQESDPLTAAVAAKLKFWWAPGFLNGLGNRVETYSWGTDNALGYLDLGQFDTWSEVPSACFAATLIPRTAWEAVGPIDEGFPLYYEDSEWSYRARMLGYTVHVAPEALIYHAFGSKVPSEEDSGLAARKLRSVVYGRLRFTGKLVSFPYLHHFLRNYGAEDLKNFFRALSRSEWSTAQAI
jgi:GT2 family glycosyltransferase